MRIGELFAGYGGLGMGVKAALGGEVAWVSDIDKGACKILAHRFPDVPNLGDITTVDWSLVEPVDVLTGGFPCQDVSSAGKRAGLKPGTRSGLWSHFAYAIDQLRPGLVVIENVRGLLSAEAHSDVEPCPWCVGDDPDGALRALGAVLGDLAGLGYDAEWVGVRAADVGACHGRFRVFVTAHPRSVGRVRRPGIEREGRGAAVGQQARRDAGDGALLPTPTTRDHKGRNQRNDDTCLTGALLPTPRATDGTKGGPNQRGSSGDLALPIAVALLPTPAVNDMGAGYTPDEWDARTGRMKAAHGNGNGHGKSLDIEVQRLLPTPRVTQPGYADDGRGGRSLDVEARLLPTPRTGNNENRQSVGYGGGKDGNFHELVTGASSWGDYAAAIATWAAILGRPAPNPTEPGTKGSPRLSPAFTEWMMGLPAGWITDVPGITRNEALKACGNGVVPQQAEAAVRWLLTVRQVVAS